MKCPFSSLNYLNMQIILGLAKEYLKVCTHKLCAVCNFRFTILKETVLSPGRYVFLSLNILKSIRAQQLRPG